LLDSHSVEYHVSWQVHDNVDKHLLYNCGSHWEPGLVNIR